jgi:hypothetical protein
MIMSLHRVFYQAFSCNLSHRNNCRERYVFRMPSFLLALTPRAVIRAASGLDNALNTATVALAGFALTSIHQQLVLKIPLAPLTVNVIRQGRATMVDRCL